MQRHITITKAVWVMDIDLRWVNQVMAFLAAADFVVSAMRTVLLFMT